MLKQSVGFLKSHWAELSVKIPVNVIFFAGYCGKNVDFCVKVWDKNPS